MRLRTGVAVVRTMGKRKPGWSVAKLTQMEFLEAEESLVMVRSGGVSRSGRFLRLYGVTWREYRHLMPPCSWTLHSSNSYM